MIPVFKKKDQNNVENYRPVSILPNLSKMYESCVYDQMYKYFNHTLSKWQCGFRKGFSTQQSSCDDRKVAKMFGQRVYKWGYINRSLKGL